jgi:hypothetical protein
MFDFRFQVEEMSDLTKKGKFPKKTLYYRDTMWKTPKKNQWELWSAAADKEDSSCPGIFSRVVMGGIS